MNLFDDIASEVPEFKEFLQYEFEKKKTEFIALSSSKSVPYSMLVDELFSPKDDDNKDSTEILEKVALLAIEAVRCELKMKRRPRTNMCPCLDFHFPMTTVPIMSRQQCLE